MTCYDFSIIGMFLLTIAALIYTYLEKDSEMSIVIPILSMIIVILLWSLFFGIAYLIGFPLK